MPTHPEKSVSSAKTSLKMREMRAKRGPARPRRSPEGWEPYAHAPVAIRRRFIKALQECHRSPTTAIKLFCIECFGYSATEPKHCEATNCVLWPYNRRMFKTGKGGEA
jgi:hypothetical protein